jgi:hypothetical protein
VFGATSGAAAQTASPVRFEVASIRRIACTDQVRDEVLSGARRPRMLVTDGRVSITYMSPTEILRSAYRVEPWALSGPDWLDEMRSDSGDDPRWREDLEAVRPGDTSGIA